jgi:hypothetical protein
MTWRGEPLLDLFLELRRLELPLGADDYALALRALDAGFGAGSRDDLAFMCQTLWAKSPEEQDLVRRTLDAHLPRRLSARQLEDLARAAGAPPPPQASPDPARDVPPPPPARPGSSGRSGGAAPSPAEDVAPRSLRSPRSAPQTGGAAPRFAGVPSAGAAAAGSGFDLVGTLPITRRQMKHAWRSFRRMRRAGPPTELDVPATLDQVSRSGVLVAPVLVPARRNQASLVVLVDEGGSMVPFERVTRALVDSAEHSGLGGVGVLHFHNVPGDVVFRDRALTELVALAEVLAAFRRPSVLVVSDAGAARGGRVPRRVEATAAFLRSLRALAPNVAWLNPTPKARWAGTTAGEIEPRAGVPMVTADPAGLLEAMAVLRGRGRG